MFRNFLKIAFRNLRKGKLFSIINIIGLSVGIACFFLIAVNVKDELSYDNFHRDPDNLYRVALERIYPDNVVFYAIIPYSIGEAMQKEFPEVTDMTRVFKFRNSVVFKYQDKTFEEDKIFFVEPNFFEMINISLIKGEAATVFANPNNLVITEETAVKYFGDDEPIGKNITTPQGEFLVSGVCENIPKNSHMEFDFVASLRLIGLHRQPNYASFSVYTYIRVREGSKPADLEKKMPDLVEKYAAGQIQARSGVSYKEYVAAGNGYNYFLQPIRDIHLRSNLTSEIKPNGNIKYVYILIAIALFLIVIACINFMNLSTARSVTRAKEVGIRKIVGSLRRSIIRQFLFESLLLSFFSVIVAGVIVRLILPLFNSLTGKELEINYSTDPSNFFLLLILGVVVGLLAGIYPAFVLSSYQPATVIKGRFSFSGRGVLLRNILVIFQFAISIVLITMTLIISRQMSYMRNTDPGFTKDNVIVIERAYSLQNRGETFKQELKKIPGVISASGSNTAISGGFYYGVMFQRQPDPEIKTTRGMNCDKDFVETMGLEITQGRGFSREFNDTMNVVINESTIKEFGWTDPVGMKIKRIGDPGEPTGEYTVIGVVKDFHYESMHKDIDSFALFSYPEQGQVFNIMSVRIKPENIGSTLEAIEKKWVEFVSQQPFAYHFLDEKLAELYKNEEASGRIFAVFSLLAIVIACIGLFGLSAYLAEQRTKEIGIRKVLGATVSQIVLLLSKNFARLVLIAFVIALPISYYFMVKWLQNFAYRTSIQVWIFLAAGLVSLLIAQLTISFQSVKAAHTNPAETLKFE